MADSSLPDIMQQFVMLTAHMTSAHELDQARRACHLTGLEQLTGNAPFFAGWMLAVCTAATLQSSNNDLLVSSAVLNLDPHNPHDFMDY